MALAVHEQLQTVAKEIVVSDLQVFEHQRNQRIGNVFFLVFFEPLDDPSTMFVKVSPETNSRPNICRVGDTLLYQKVQDFFRISHCPQELFAKKKCYCSPIVLEQYSDLW